MQRKLFTYRLLWIMLALFLGSGTLFAWCLAWETNCNEWVNLNLSITSNYQGVSNLWWNFYWSWWVLYTATTLNILELWATATSTYTITWDIYWTPTGSWTWSYTTQQSIELPWPDWLKNLQVIYESAWEPYVTDPLNLYLDTTPPTTPNAITPLAGEDIHTEWVFFSWTNSTDWWSWLKEYVLSVSTDPTMSTLISFTTTQSSLLVNEDLLPDWDLYWTVTAIDNVWNQITGIPSFFSAIKASFGSSTSIWTVTNTPYETDWAPENDNHTDVENTEILDHNQLPQELLLIFDEWDEHWLEQDLSDNVDQKVTYIFQVDKKPSVIEIIKKNNQIQVLINQLQEDKHLVVTTDLISTINDTQWELALPKYLFRKWADLNELQHHLSLLAKYFPDPVIREQLYTAIHYIMPYWRWWAIIFIALLCYDIEIYRRWITNITKK